MWPARRQTERTSSKSTSCILQHEEHFLSRCPLPGLFWEQACMYFKHLEQVTSPRVACALVPIPTVKLSSVTLAERKQPLKKSSFSTDSKSKSAAMRREQTIRHESETRPPRAAHRNHRRRPAEAASGKTMACCRGTEPGRRRCCCNSGRFFRSGAASIVRVNVKELPTVGDVLSLWSNWLWPEFSENATALAACSQHVAAVHCCAVENLTGPSEICDWGFAQSPTRFFLTSLKHFLLVLLPDVMDAKIWGSLFFFLSDVPGWTEPMNNVVCICLRLMSANPPGCLTEVTSAAIKGVKHSLNANHPTE